MTGAKHTPGPWRLEMVEDRTIKHLCPVGVDDLSLLTVVQHDSTPFAAVYADADACLIAAAPDLLEELRLMVQQFAQYVPAAPNGANEAYRISKARAAIAKATGGAA